MSHTPPRHHCPRPVCSRGLPVHHGPVPRDGAGPHHGASRTPAPPAGHIPSTGHVLSTDRTPSTCRARPDRHMPSAYHRPVRTPARTPVRRTPVGRCGAPLLAGHRTPGDVYLLAQRMAEVLVGRRAPEVLRNQLAVPVREELRRLRGTISCELAPRLPRVFHQPLASDTVEASAVISCDRRSRVFAFRAHREGDRWVCTRLETDGDR